MRSPADIFLRAVRGGRPQPRGFSVIALITVASTLALAATALPLRPVAGQANSAIGVSGLSQDEKFPTPRDPRYIPPFLPPQLRGQLQGEQVGVLSVFSAEGDGASLAAYYAERRRAAAAAARRADRYGERADQALDEAGEERLLSETAILRQFGRSGFPRDFAYAGAHEESDGKRFAVVSILATPFTTGLSFGLLQLGRMIGGETGPPDAPSSWIAGGVGVLAALAIGWHDYRELVQLRAGYEERALRLQRYYYEGPRGVRGPADGFDDSSRAQSDAQRRVASPRAGEGAVDRNAGRAPELRLEWRTSF